MHFKFFNLYIILSYLGIFPFIFVILDVHFFNIFILNLLKEFVIYYALLVYAFIGAMRWSFNNTPDFIEILFGFIPSFFSAIIIIVSLLEFNQDLLLFCICMLLILQLIGDYLIYKKHNIEKRFFFKIRIPLTIIVFTAIFYLIIV